MTSTQPQPISVPLGKDAHRWAEIFAAEQATPQKGKQVYLNTLAVCAVHSYLKWLMVETNLTCGDSWQPGLRALFDVADLVVPNIGKLECRPVLPGEVSFELPLEANQDRIGYVAVQFNRQLDSVHILGFARAVTSYVPLQKFPLTQLQPLDHLIETIHYKQVNKRDPKSEQLLVNLRQWLEGIFSQDWQPTGLVLAGNFRNIANVTDSVSRAKEIHLAGQPLILVIQVMPALTESVNIRLRLYAGNNGISLPENLLLILFDEAGTACMEAQAGKTDSWMELEFSCQPNEVFSVKVVLEGTSLTEKFVV
ncbi:hypothetical protein NUACC21_56830 [Scytonema sp. NUACC21]